MYVCTDGSNPPFSVTHPFSSFLGSSIIIHPRSHDGDDEEDDDDDAGGKARAGEAAAKAGEQVASSSSLIWKSCIAHDVER